MYRDKKSFKRIITVLLILILLVTGCAGNNEDTANESSQNTGTQTDDTQTNETVDMTSASTAKTSAYENYQVYTDKKIESTYNVNSSSTIELNGTNATSDDSSVVIESGSVTITAKGDYILSGDYTGTIIITVPETDDVRLILDNVNIKGDTNSAIYCTQGDDLIVILAEGSVNTLEDAGDFTYTDTTNEEPDATLFSKIDLAITGSGELDIIANYNNGIGTKDDLVLSTGVFNITAANHGIRGRDSISIVNGTYDIEAGVDAIQSNNADDETKGWISIEDGNFTLNSGNDGMQAETTLGIWGGNFTLTSGGGSETRISDTTASYKGIKAVGALYVEGGEYDINSADDAIHSNLDIDIEGGVFTIASGDDGIHADSDMIVNPSSINITTCYEGIESMTMTINGGDINIYATDDGINIAGGNDTSGEGQFGGDTFQGGGRGGGGAGAAPGQAAEGTTSTSEQWVQVNDCNMTITALSDGIDVNGNAVIDGGSIYVTSVLSEVEVALDYDGTFVMNGGELVATAGYSNMTQNVDSSSSVTSMMVVYDSNQAEGSAISISDDAGNVVFEYTPPSAFRTILICSPSLSQNVDYTVSTGGSTNFTTTLSAAVTNLSESGSETSVSGAMMGGGGGGQGQGGNMGGGQGQGQGGGQGGALPNQ
ncbi:MAG: carbohydrate-binding domain-containing protein [Suipraeoptans sp.]